MATYVYKCDCGNQTEEDFPIGTARKLRGCEECQGMMRQVLGVGVHIGAGAMPNKKAAVLDTDRRDVVLDKDLGAYKRMRDRGLQPKHVDGSSKIESEVGEQFDIDHSTIYSLHKDRSKESVRDSILEGYETAAQINAEAS